MSHTLIQDALFTAKSSRELDRLAREQQGIAGTVLMKRAARAALAADPRWLPVHRVLPCQRRPEVGIGGIRRRSIAIATTRPELTAS